MAQYFYFVVIGDSHIIDDYYVGPENSPLDTETIFKTREHLTLTCQTLNAIELPLEAVFHVGDYIHDYPSTDWDFYFNNSTRFDHARAITDQLRMPLHINFGNHDYANHIDRDFTHELFWEKFRTRPYYAVKYHNYKFLQVNNFIGETWNPKSDLFNVQLGSLGLEQLDWLEAELSEGLPTFIFVHFPLPSILAQEHLDRGMLSILDRYKDSVQHIFSGHHHRWMEFSDRSGLPNLIIGSTRYDPNAYVVVEVNKRSGHYRFLNESDWLWFSYYTKTSRSNNNQADLSFDPKRIHQWR